MQISIEEMGVLLMKKQNNFLTENPEYIAGFLAGCRASVSADIFRTFGEKYDYDVDSPEFYFGYEQGFKDAADCACEKAFGYDVNIATARNLATELRTISDNAIACNREFEFEENEDGEYEEDFYEDGGYEDGGSSWESYMRRSNPRLGSTVEYRKIDNFENIKRQLLCSRNKLGSDECEHEYQRLCELISKVEELEYDYIVKQVIAQYAELKSKGFTD